MSNLPLDDTTKAPKRLAVSVKRRHIRYGERSAIQCCPIAIALREQTGHMTSVLNFHASVAHFGYYRMSKAARDFISRFDTGHKVRPARFVFTRQP